MKSGASNLHEGSKLRKSYKPRELAGQGGGLVCGKVQYLSLVEFES